MSTLWWCCQCATAWSSRHALLSRTTTTPIPPVTPSPLAAIVLHGSPSPNANGKNKEEDWRQ